jgi:hypothetical protein
LKNGPGKPEEETGIKYGSMHCLVLIPEIYQSRGSPDVIIPSRLWTEVNITSGAQGRKCNEVFGFGE